MAGRIKGKVAIIVGAGDDRDGSGIGQSIATLFAREGARVICSDLDHAAAEATAARIRAEGGEALAVAGDPVVQSEGRAIIAAALDHHGRLDILANSFGITSPGGVVDCQEEDWDRVMDVNVKGTFLMMKHALPAMARQGGGAIVNLSSVAAFRHIGIPDAGFHASKAALSHLTRTTALEWAARRIRVNAVLPGPAAIAAPLGRACAPLDIARAALFLASDDAGFVTGTELVVDGGLSLG